MKVQTNGKVKKQNHVLNPFHKPTFLIANAINYAKK